MAQPTRDRLLVLDVLRGFAMLGVLLANLYVLYSLRFATRTAPPTSFVDKLADAFMHFVVQGKAQTLLTLLFGFGFAVQLLRAQDRGEPIVALYLRRLGTLFVIGWLHVLLLAWVDVTWGYALVGFALLAFLRVSNRTRVVVALVCTVGPSILYAFPSVRPALHAVLFDEPRQVYVMRFAEAVRAGDWLAISKHNAMLGLVWTFGGSVLWYLPWLLGRFLLGYVVGAQRWFAVEGERHGLFEKVLVIGALVALPGLVLDGVQYFQLVRLQGHAIAADAALAVVKELGLLGQVAMYVAAVVLLVRGPRWRRVLGVLAPVGRMPLTTYLMQSAICTSLFYGWGLGWSTPPAAACVALGLLIFTLQTAFAHLWLRWFQLGPAEWLWRTVVYLRAQPMRRRS